MHGEREEGRKGGKGERRKEGKNGRRGDGSEYMSTEACSVLLGEEKRRGDEKIPMDE